MKDFRSYDTCFVVGLRRVHEAGSFLTPMDGFIGINVRGVRVLMHEPSYHHTQN